MYVISSTLFLSVIGAANSIKVFNCSGNELNYTTISLVDVPNCEYHHRNPTRHNFQGQIVQRISYQTIQTYQCRVKATRFAQNCDNWSSSRMMKKNLVVYVKEMSRSICLEAINNRRYNYFGDLWVHDLKLNRTNLYSSTIKGMTGYSWECSGEDFEDEYGRYENSVINAQYDIAIHIMTGVLDLSSGHIKLPNRENCIYSDSTCNDYDGYSYYWDVSRNHECDFSNFGIIYSGPLEILSYPNTHGPSYTYILLNTTTNLISLRKTNTRSICLREIYETNVDSIIIFTWEHSIMTRHSNKPEALDISINLQYLSKLTGVDIHMHQQFSSLFSLLSYNDCLLDRTTTILNLHVGYVDPIEFAYIYNKGPGATAITAGEVIHVAQCKPIFGIIRSTSTYYKEIPIMFHVDHCLQIPELVYYKIMVRQYLVQVYFPL